MTYSITDITQSCRDCRKERTIFQQRQEVSSPACVALFRYAVQQNEQEAWACINEIFSPQLLKRAGRQSTFDPADVVQEAWASFYQATSRDFEFVDGADLRPIISYLNRCVQTAVARMSRKLPPLKSIPIEDLSKIIQSVTEEIEQTAQEVDLNELIERFFISYEFSDKERLLFSLTFRLCLKPAEIMADYPSLYEEYDALEVARQRIKRRVVKYPAFQNLKIERRKPEDSALLKIVTDQTMSRNENTTDGICVYSDEVLLEYIMKTISAELINNIEASPDCIRRVAQLRAEIGPFLQAVYRKDCPSPDNLVAYQRREISGTPRLVLYRHIEGCLRCREDLVMIEAVGADNDAQPSVLRRLVEAVYHSPLEFGLQGEWLHFRTSGYIINIRTRRAQGKERRWTASIQLRSLEGELLTKEIESAILGSLNPVTPVYRIDKTNNGSSLIFKEVEMGEYHLALMLSEEEIIIRKIAVGFDG